MTSDSNRFSQGVVRKPSSAQRKPENRKPAQRKPEKQPKIPHQLIFTHKTNLLKQTPPVQDENTTQADLDLYQNLLRTIEHYKTKWQNPDLTVHFLTDEDCRIALLNTEPKLVLYFRSEVIGMFRADMCRIAALYQYGGYYMDVDLQLIEPLSLPEEVRFATVESVPRKQDEEYPRFFQAFLASEPGHPILKQALQVMLAHYDHSHRMEGEQMGCLTLAKAFYDTASLQENTPHDATKGKLLEWPRESGVRLLHEINLVNNTKSYPNLERQNGKGAACNSIVVNPETNRPHFYSRFVGASKWCDYPEEAKEYIR